MGMKKSSTTGFLFSIGLMILVNGNLFAQTSHDKSADMKKAKEWFSSREWANGSSIKAHQSVNILEFSRQYHLNKTYWAEAFDFLKNTNLDTLSPGKYNIDGSNVYALVTDGPTKAFEDTKWENHRNFIDVQYVVRGREKMGMAPLSKATVTEPYNDEKDIAFSSVPDNECDYYVAVPGTFLIFFPQDAHRPAIRAEGSDTVKKVVIKIRAVADPGH
jgi:YhcH/YjgK/YiaL family protein